MAKFQNNKVRKLHNPALGLCFEHLAVNCMLLALCIIFLLAFYPGMANGQGPYLKSAHGGNGVSSGVNRDSLTIFGYAAGNCAHCHEQHSSIGGSEPAPSADAGPDKYELFGRLFDDQSTTFCFGCHKGVGSLQQNIPPNYNYSRMAGDDGTITCPSAIRQAFQFVDDSGNPQPNCGSIGGSSHFLDNIRSFLSRQSWEFGSDVENINPCSGCHNPHRAQKDPFTSTGRIGLDGKLVSSLTMPSRHTSLTATDLLWGDDSTERMNKYHYQPPCRFPFSPTCTLFEPDGSNISDASRTVDYVTFCLDCHQYDTGKTRAINWAIDGDIHGAGFQDCVCDYGDKRHPYSDGDHYVLSCLDCHEPHGSPNEYLLRQEVNGRSDITFETHKYFRFCLSCHRNMDKHLGGVPAIDPNVDCWGCHNHGAVFPTTDLTNCTGCGAAIRSF